MKTTKPEKTIAQVFEEFLTEQGNAVGGSSPLGVVS